MPADNSFVFDHYKNVFPFLPRFSESYPEYSVAIMKNRPSSLGFENSQLLPESEVLENQILLRTKCRLDKPEQEIEE